MVPPRSEHKEGGKISPNNKIVKVGQVPTDGNYLSIYKKKGKHSHRKRRMKLWEKMGMIHGVSF